MAHPYGNFLLILHDPVQMLFPAEPIPWTGLPTICVPIAFDTNPHEDTCDIIVIYVSDCPHWTGGGTIRYIYIYIYLSSESMKPKGYY